MTSPPVHTHTSCRHTGQDIIEQEQIGQDHDWSFVPGVYCISLKERHDRYQQALHQFRKVGLDKHVTWYRPDRPSLQELHSKNIPTRLRGEYGCWCSHQAVIKDAYDKGLPYALIFEDDIHFLPHWTAAVTRTIQECIHSVPFDIFFLGHTPFLSLPTSHAAITFTYSTSTHAYIISRKFMPQVLATAYDQWGFLGRTRGIDSLYLFRATCYALYPQVAIQSGSASDIIVAAQADGSANTNNVTNDIVTANMWWSRQREAFTLNVAPAVLIIIMVVCVLIFILSTVNT